MFLVFFILVKKLLKNVCLSIMRDGNTMSKFKLVMFDMDGTLLKGRGIFVIAEKKGFLDELSNLIKHNNMDYYEKSIEVAKLTKGLNIDDMLQIFRSIPFQEHVDIVIRELKKRDIKTAIATDSYIFLADDLKRRLGIDYVFGNNLIFNDKISTGELELHNKDLSIDNISGKIYSICKSCILEQLCIDIGISTDKAIAIGDGIVDKSMIKKAGLGIAFNTTDEVSMYADVVTNDLSVILEYI
jgi:phosphoserine phosphatase